MSSEKKLQKATIKFRKENPELHFTCSLLISRMAKFVEKIGAVEVTAGIINGEYYEYANN